MESDGALNVYSEAKSEYMFQLCSYLTPAYFSFYVDLLERAKEETAAEPKKQLWHFQNLLAEIEDWNMERVSREVAMIQTRAACDFLEDLLTAVFIAHTKVLTAIRLHSKQKKVHITVPKIEHFLLKVFCETSRLLWQSAYLFRENVSGMERQQNYQKVQGLIETGVRSAIRAMVPVKSLLKDCVHGEDEEEEEEDVPVAEPVAPAAAEHVAEPVPVAATPVEEDVPMPVPVADAPQENVDVPVSVASAVEDVPVPVVSPAPATHAQHEEVAATPAVAEEPESTTRNIEPLKKLPEARSIQKLDEVMEMPQEPINELIPPQPNLIVVDDEPGVTFSEYETIFDTENSDGNHMQPTQFHENEPNMSESIEILGEIDGPLEADEIDDFGSVTSADIEAEEVM